MKTISLILLAMLFCTANAFAGSAGFIDNGNGTVMDLTTNLMWQQCSAGLSGADCATGSATTYVWDPDALSYCQSLSLGGFSDWRLPKIKELQSIADLTRITPAISTTYFPNTQSSSYWSSTSLVGSTQAWFMVFDQGYTSHDFKTNAYYVRCVRGGQ